MHSVDFKDSMNLPKISLKETEKQKLFVVVGFEAKWITNFIGVWLKAKAI